ncbi:MAG: hypothetical protein LBP40_01560 [Campylobacteraceae bacterium]|jgi:DNA invertase Pin-like site-specific DNA recombinase|nr:hypothetical protein [Campylobacteraceae bacterium]
MRNISAEQTEAILAVIAKFAAADKKERTRELKRQRRLKGAKVFDTSFGKRDILQIFTILKGVKHG